uniref:Uncharacterized protein n=1 Tax=Romanomermis culicivorax TaxID=13658 RepID=A0A915JSP6_ROMCU
PTTVGAKGQRPRRQRLQTSSERKTFKGILQLITSHLCHTDLDPWTKPIGLSGSSQPKNLVSFRIVLVVALPNWIQKTTITREMAEKLFTMCDPSRHKESILIDD